MVPIAFDLFVIGIMLIITLLSWLVAKEYFAVDTYKNSRKKIVRLNLVIIVLFAILYPKGILPLAYTAVLGQLVVLWFLLQVSLVVLGLLVKIFRQLYEKTSGQQVDAGRRRFLRGLIWVPAVSGIVYGGMYERRHIEFIDVDIDVSSAPRLNGLKIAQLSDVHIGSFFSVNQLQSVLNQVVQKSPDILVLTGDIFDNVELNDAAIELIDKYTGYFPFGVYFCWGNHEHIRKFEHLQEALSKTNIIVLDNASVKVLSGERPLYILGVDYVDGSEDAETITERDDYVREALGGVPNNAYKILLAHHSIFIDNGIENNIELTLTGHTHGGQFGVAGIPVFPAYKYTRGRVDKNGCVGYVNRGAGSWFPYRIGCPPEVTIFNFTAKG